MDLTLYRDDVDYLIMAVKQARKSVANVNNISTDAARDYFILKCDDLLDKLINRQVQRLHPDKEGGA